MILYVFAYLLRCLGSRLVVCPPETDTVVDLHRFMLLLLDVVPWWAAFGFVAGCCGWVGGEVSSFSPSVPFKDEVWVRVWSEVGKRFHLDPFGGFWWIIGWDHSRYFMTKYLRAYRWRCLLRTCHGSSVIALQVQSQTSFKPWAILELCHEPRQDLANYGNTWAICVCFYTQIVLVQMHFCIIYATLHDFAIIGWLGLDRAHLAD